MIKESLPIFLVLLTVVPPSLWNPFEFRSGHVTCFDQGNAGRSDPFQIFLRESTWFTISPFPSAMVTHMAGAAISHILLALLCEHVE